MRVRSKRCYICKKYNSKSHAILSPKFRHLPQHRLLSGVFLKSGTEGFVRGREICGGYEKDPQGPWGFPRDGGTPVGSVNIQEAGNSGISRIISNTLFCIMNAARK
jgi:hypothetical protein